MATLNKVQLIGNLVADVELRTTTSEKSVGNFRLAIDSGIGDNKKTVFLNCVIWGVQAENLAKFKSKGDCVYVEGELREEVWEKEGEKRSRLVVNADRVLFIGSSKKDESEIETPKQTSKPSGKPQSKPAKSSKNEDDEIF